MWGPLAQYGVGRRAGTELMHKSVLALVDEDPSKVVVAFDARNAFGSIPRPKVWEGVLSRMPDLAPTVAAWLGGPTVHAHWDERGVVTPVTAASGVDQGCPLSPLLFALGLAPALDAIVQQLQALDASARAFAYLDDIVVVVPPGRAEAAHDIVETCLGQCGLALNRDKTEVWSRNGLTVTGALAERVVERISLLGASVAWWDEEEREEGQVPLGGQASGRSPLAQARALNQRLAQLRAAGIGLKTAFTVLRVFAQSCANHLQRANLEDGAWVADLDAELHRGLELLVGQDTTDTQRLWRRLAPSRVALPLVGSAGVPPRLSWAAGPSTCGR